jgi:hypothetical protein
MVGQQGGRRGCSLGAWSVGSDIGCLLVGCEWVLCKGWGAREGGPLATSVHLRAAPLCPITPLITPLQTANPPSPPSLSPHRRTFARGARAPGCASSSPGCPTRSGSRRSGRGLHVGPFLIPPPSGLVGLGGWSCFLLGHPCCLRRRRRFHGCDVRMGNVMGNVRDGQRDGQREGWDERKHQGGTGEGVGGELWGGEGGVYLSRGGLWRVCAHATWRP